MSDLNLDFFKKRPSEELFETVKELAGNNLRYKALLSDLEEEDEED